MDFPSAAQAQRESVKKLEKLTNFSSPLSNRRIVKIEIIFRYARKSAKIEGEGDLEACPPERIRAS
mgnify:CR=1 FL=1